MSNPEKRMKISQRSRKRKHSSKPAIKGNGMSNSTKSSHITGKKRKREEDLDFDILPDPKKSKRNTPNKDFVKASMGTHCQKFQLEKKRDIFDQNDTSSPRNTSSNLPSSIRSEQIRQKAIGFRRKNVVEQRVEFVKPIPKPPSSKPPQKEEIGSILSSFADGLDKGTLLDDFELKGNKLRDDKNESSSTAPPPSPIENDEDDIIVDSSSEESEEEESEESEESEEEEEKQVGGDRGGDLFEVFDASDPESDVEDDEDDEREIIEDDEDDEEMHNDVEGFKLYLKGLQREQLIPSWEPKEMIIPNDFKQICKKIVHKEKRIRRQLLDNNMDKHQKPSQLICNRMGQLHLLHGFPGTGKTTFGSFLLDRLNKRWIQLNLDDKGNHFQSRLNKKNKNKKRVNAYEIDYFETDETLQFLFKFCEQSFKKKKPLPNQQQQQQQQQRSILEEEDDDDDSDNDLLLNEQQQEQANDDFRGEPKKKFSYDFTKFPSIFEFMEQFFCDLVVELNDPVLLFEICEYFFSCDSFLNSFFYNNENQRIENGFYKKHKSFFMNESVEHRIHEKYVKPHLKHKKRKNHKDWLNRRTSFMKTRSKKKSQRGTKEEEELPLTEKEEFSVFLGVSKFLCLKLNVHFILFENFEHFSTLEKNKTNKRSQPQHQTTTPITTTTRTRTNSAMGMTTPTGKKKKFRVDKTISQTQQKLNSFKRGFNEFFNKKGKRRRRRGGGRRSSTSSNIEKQIDPVSLNTDFLSFSLGFKSKNFDFLFSVLLESLHLNVLGITNLTKLKFKNLEDQLRCMEDFKMWILEFNQNEINECLPLTENSVFDRVNGIAPIKGRGGRMSFGTNDVDTHKNVICPPPPRNSLSTQKKMLQPKYVLQVKYFRRSNFISIENFRDRKLVEQFLWKRVEERPSFSVHKESIEFFLSPIIRLCAMLYKGKAFMNLKILLDVFNGYLKELLRSFELSKREMEKDFFRDRKRKEYQCFVFKKLKEKNDTLKELDPVIRIKDLMLTERSTSLLFYSVFSYMKQLRVAQLKERQRQRQRNGQNKNDYNEEAEEDEIEEKSNFALNFSNSYSLSLKSFYRGFYKNLGNGRIIPGLLKNDFGDFKEDCYRILKQYKFAIFSKGNKKEEHDEHDEHEDDDEDDDDDDEKMVDEEEFFYNGKETDDKDVFIVRWGISFQDLKKIFASFDLKRMMI